MGAYDKLINKALLSRFLAKVKALIPTKVSDLTNDAGYLTLDDLPVYDGSVTNEP